mgnify:CR=1 FL=1
MKHLGLEYSILLGGVRNVLSKMFNKLCSHFVYHSVWYNSFIQIWQFGNDISVSHLYLIPKGKSFV